MGVGRSRLLELLTGLTSSSSAQRSRSADEVTDWLHGYSDIEALVVSYVLVCLMLEEMNQECQEAQLHALAELAEHDLVAPFVLQEVHGLARDQLAGSALEHYDYLTSR